MAEIVRGSPTVQPYLRKFRQPLYDEEKVGNGAATQRVQFFSRPQGQADAAGWAKTARDTNLTIAGQLGARQEFYLVGFNIMLDWDILALPRHASTWPAANNELYAMQQMITDSLFRFQFGQTQYLVEVPLERIPFGGGPYGNIYSGSVTLAAFGREVSHVLTNHMPSVREFYDVRLRRTRPRHIQPDQAFSCVVEWLNGAITIGTSTGEEWYRLMVYAVGIRLTAI